MPRLLPPDWIKKVAVDHLLQLYEKDNKFVQELEEARRPFVPLIEQYVHANCLTEVEHILSICPPDDLTALAADLQKLRNHYQSIPGNPDLSELQKSYDRLREQLKPYVAVLQKLAYKWNLRAPWAADELIQRDIQRVYETTFNAAGVTVLNKLSNQQIHRLLKEDEGSLHSDTWQANMNIVTFCLAAGRTGYIKELNERLEQFEGKLKAAGAKEPPSALRKHAGWWFDHYVRNVKFSDIADGIAQVDSKGGHQTENIRKAVLKFSELLSIEPTERV